MSDEPARGMWLDDGPLPTAAAREITDCTVLFALALWGTFEGFSRDGALLRVIGRQGRSMRDESPTIDSSD